MGAASRSTRCCVSSSASRRFRSLGGCSECSGAWRRAPAASCASTDRSAGSVLVRVVGPGRIVRARFEDPWPSSRLGRHAMSRCAVALLAVRVPISRVRIRAPSSSPSAHCEADTSGTPSDAVRWAPPSRSRRPVRPRSTSARGPDRAWLGPRERAPRGYPNIAGAASAAAIACGSAAGSASPISSEARITRRRE